MIYIHVDPRWLVGGGMGAVTVAILTYLAKKRGEQIKFETYVESLNNRIVTFLPEAKRDYQIKAKFGRIEDIRNYSIKNRTISHVAVAILKSNKQYDKEYKEYEKKYEKVKERNMQYVADWQKRHGGYTQQIYSQYSQGFGQIPCQQDPYPDEPGETEEKTKFLRFNTIRVMPRNFDYVSESVPKELKVKQEKEVKSVKKMPRIFKYPLYLAFVAIVWDVVINFNNIAMFVVHTFILQK